MANFHPILRPRTYLTVQDLARSVSANVARTEAAQQVTADAYATLAKVKSAFLFRAGRAVEKQFKAKQQLLDRHKDRLEKIHQDLVMQSEELLAGAVSDAAVPLVKDRLDKILEVLIEEEQNVPSLDLALDVVSQQTLKSLQQRSCKGCACKENQPANIVRDKVPEPNVDSLIAEKLEQLAASLDKPATVEVSEDFCSFKSLGSLNVLKLAVHSYVNQLQSAEAKHVEELQDEVNTLREQLMKAHTEQSELNQLRNELDTAHLQLAETNQLRNELAEAHNQLAETSQLRRKLAETQFAETSHLRTQLAEAHNQLAEVNRQHLSLKLQWEKSQAQLREVEQLLIEWRHPQPTKAYDRQLQIIKSIYTDRYNELFRITTTQINDLENQLACAQSQNRTRVDAALAKERKVLAAAREAEVSKAKAETRKQLTEVNSQLQEILQTKECALTQQLQALAAVVQTAMQPVSNDSARRTLSLDSACTFVHSRDSEEIADFSATDALEAYLSKYA